LASLSAAAVAVTRGPGLAGCLLVGVEYAKALALRHGKPLVCVHHIGGHVWSPWLGRETDAWGNAADCATPFEPYVALIVSGGHSSLVHVRTPLNYETMGETLDDAAGEAYDKVAKLLGLGYPGGPLVDRIAGTGNPSAFDLPRPMMRSDAGFDFSFSGLKTAVARHVEEAERGGHAPLSREFVADMCASFQAAVIDVLLKKADLAMLRVRHRRLAVAGGVACNSGLRAAARARLSHYKVVFPAPEYCGDNAAMIAGLGFHVHRAGLNADDGFNAAPGLALAMGTTGWRD